MDGQDPRSAKKATKVEIIFERLSIIENTTHSLKSNSKTIKQKLLGSFPEADMKSDVAETVSPSGILQAIIDQLGDIKDNLQHTSGYLDRVTKEIEKK